MEGGERILFNHPQMKDVWPRIIKNASETVLEALLVTNIYFSKIVTQEFRRLRILWEVFIKEEHTHNRFYHNEGDYAAIACKQIGKLRVSPPKLINCFEFAVDNSRWDCATLIFQNLTQYERGALLLKHKRNVPLIKSLLKERVYVRLPLMTTTENCEELCEIVNDFPKKLKKYYVKLFMVPVKEKNAYNELRKSFATLSF